MSASLTQNSMGQIPNGSVAKFKGGNRDNFTSENLEMVTFEEAFDDEEGFFMWGARETLGEVKEEFIKLIGKSLGGCLRGGLIFG